MSFKFEWGKFSEDLVEKARKGLEAGLNKGTKPHTIVDTIYVKLLTFGTQAPTLEIVEIDELSEDKFEGIFKLSYSGDAYVILQTKVQANPISLNVGRGGIVAADKELICPMELRIKNFNLKGVISLSVSRTRGVTIGFKNDPLESVEVSSSFDNVPNTRRYLQIQIENQIRQFILEGIPKLVHEQSLQKIKSQQSQQNYNSDDDDDHENTPNSNTPESSRRSSFSDEIPATGRSPIVVESNRTTSEMARLFTANNTLSINSPKNISSNSAFLPRAFPLSTPQKKKTVPVRRKLFPASSSPP